MSPRETSEGPLFEAGGALIYLTASELPNLLLSDSIFMAPVSRHASSLSTRIVEGRGPLAFLRPASAWAIRYLTNEASKDQVLALRITHPLRVPGAIQLSTGLVELPPTVSLTRASTVLYQSQEQASRIQANLKLSRTDLDILGHKVEPESFDGDVELTQDQVARLSNTHDPRIAERMRFSERLLGALMAGPVAEGWLDPKVPYGQTIATLGGAAWHGTDHRVAEIELRFHGIETQDPDALALMGALGIKESLPGSPWRGDVDAAYLHADRSVAQAAYKTALNVDDAKVPARSMLDAIVRAVENVDASHGTGLSDRYRKAADLVDSVNTNKRRLDQVLSLPTWHQGFESLQALLLLGTAKDDEFERVWSRSASTDVTPRARVLARSLFGAAFGMRAIPPEHRPSRLQRRVVHGIVERISSHIFSDVPMSIVTELRATGRGNRRTFQLSAAVLDEDIPLRTTIAHRKAAEIVARIAHLKPQTWNRFADQIKRQPELRHLIHYSWTRPAGVRVVNEGLRWVGGPEDDTPLMPKPFVPDWERFSQEVYEFLSSSEARVINNWKRFLDKLESGTR